MPTIWLIVSGVFFAVNTLFLTCLIIALMKLAKIAQELKPKVDAISERVESIATKVDSVASKVDAMTTDLKGTVQTLGQRTTRVAESADMIAGLTSLGAQRYAPALTVLSLAVKAFRLFKASGARPPRLFGKRKK